MNVYDIMTLENCVELLRLGYTLVIEDGHITGIEKL